VTAWRIDELRQTLYFARQARASLTAGNLASAFRWNQLATRSLYLVRGLSCRPGCNPTATATLPRALDRLSNLIEEALRPLPIVDPVELVPHLFEGLQVLQREGVDVDDETLLARARNQAMHLAGLYQFIAIRNDHARN
jgi:hypothetical protein